MLRVALSHDVDRITKTHQYITRVMKNVARGRLGAVFHELRYLQNRSVVYWNFEDIMYAEEKLGVKSTFFLLQESYPFVLTRPSEWKLSLGRYDIRSERVSGIIRELDAGGWEIGLHGSYLSYKDPNLLKNEKDILEQVLGKPVIGVRQHYLNLCDETWRYQEQAGFRYDSSYGFTDRLGYKQERIKPFHPNGSDFCVFPLAIMDSCYAEDENRSLHLEQIISQTIENDGVLVLNWHSNSWNPVEYPHYQELYVSLIKKLQAMGAVFNTLRSFYQEFLQV